MSITPVERDGEGDQEDRELAWNRRQGVRARVKSWLQSVGRGLRNLRQRFHGADSDSPTPERSPDDKQGEIRVGGQRRLEPRSTTERDADSAETSSVRRGLPSTDDGDAERDGNRLHNPDRPDAYITSDTWEDIER
jgi:hypothetical protein